MRSLNKRRNGKVKSEISNPSVDFKYPGLYVNRWKTVVLFSEPKAGVVVHAGNGLIKVGEYSDEWLMDLFTPFTGTVTLSN